MRSQSGFTRFEFTFLTLAGLMIAAILAHFLIDQNLQLQRLNAMIERDAVRLNVEGRMMDAEVITKSVQASSETEESTMNLRACVLGEAKCADRGKECCQARKRDALLILDLGDERHVLGGTKNESSCLDKDGIPTNGECFATATAMVEAVCPENRATCKKASGLMLHYRIDFLSRYLKNDAELGTLERTVSVLTE